MNILTIRGIAMDFKAKVDEWLQFEELDETLKAQLSEMMDDETAITDSFYKELEFGTGGMRGVLGPGTNRMNIYTVRKGAEGLARYIKDQGAEAMARGVVIAYDNRHMSPEFALEIAKVVGKHGIRAYVFESLRPTPVLSFAVRYLHAFSGVMITASHNPPQYNGMKIYGEDGGQLPLEPADEVIRYVQGAGSELTIETADEKELLANDLLTYIGEKVDFAYNEALQTIQLRDVNTKDLKIVFTPLHGTANHPVRRGLESLGYENVIIVKEQELPDADFSTVKSPNPEEISAFELAIGYAKEHDADIIIGTDPDADRIGILSRTENGEYFPLNGNQLGVLFLHYILSTRKELNQLPENGIAIKTIVTTELSRAIAEDFNIASLDVLTGFKFIGEKIKEYETTGEHTYLFGFEESYGYLIREFARDKDAVQAAIFAAEIAAYYKEQGKTVADALFEIFETYGYYLEGQTSLVLEGALGQKHIAAIIDTLREEPIREVNGIAVQTIEDYATSVSEDVATGEKTDINLPQSNVLKYKLVDGSWFCVRPSGTEPKMKYYYAVKGNSQEEGEQGLAALKQELTTVFNNIYDKIKN